VSTVVTTASGAKIDYLRPKNIPLEDIALGLSRQPRFVGQTTRPYSVAQHSLLVMELVPYHKMYALIHDAAEALLCDIPTPAKEAMRILSKGDSPYDKLEDRLYRAICRTVGIKPKWRVSVKIADSMARPIEASLLHPKSGLGVRVSKEKRKLLKGILALPDGGRKKWLESARRMCRNCTA
jgi:hypothetical protein